MPFPHGKHKFSKKQVGFFGAVASGKANKKTSLTKDEAKKMLHEQANAVLKEGK